MIDPNSNITFNSK